MKILIDGDSCPVINQTTDLAKDYNLKLIIVKNHNHNLISNYAEVVSVEPTKDSADFYIVNNSNPGDIIITQDYGLAAMALAKNAKVVNPNGLIIDTNNVDTLLHQRYISSEMRRQKRHYGSKNKKRTETLNQKFIDSLLFLINI